MRLVFAGTPDVALPSLEAIDAGGHDLVAVLTRPDAQRGRGRKVVASPVAAWARERGIETLTPQRPSDPETVARLRELAPDCCPVVAYGALVPDDLLAVPTHGWVNLHFSVLPAWRGAAPVQHALLAGDEITGATTFRLVHELDAGPVYGVLTERVRDDDTSADLLGRLATAGAGLLHDTLDHLEAGDLEARTQPTDGISYAPKISVDDALVRWTDPAVTVDRRIRACTPSPGAWTTLGGERLKIGPVRPLATGTVDPGTDEMLAPGVLRIAKQSVDVGTATTPVRLGTVQPHGRRPMPAADWARGARLGEVGGTRFDLVGPDAPGVNGGS